MKWDMYSKMLKIETQQSNQFRVKLHLQNGKAVSTCSFYRLPSSQVKGMNDLNEEIEAVYDDHVSRT